MVTIKQFRDGDRLIVVFEGLTDMPSEEDMIRNYLKGIVSGSGEVTQAAPFDAQPVPEREEYVPEIPKPVFLDGVCKGMTPGEAFQKAISDKKTAAIWYALGRAYSFVDDPELHDEVVRVADVHTRKQFAGIDADKYAAKLSDGQRAVFYLRYGHLVDIDKRSAILAKYGVKNWNEIVIPDPKKCQSDICVNAVADIIRTFQ